jgi:hypothetical protein
MMPTEKEIRDLAAGLNNSYSDLPRFINEEEYKISEPNKEEYIKEIYFDKATYFENNKLSYNLDPEAEEEITILKRNSEEINNQIRAMALAEDRKIAEEIARKSAGERIAASFAGLRKLASASYQPPAGMRRQPKVIREAQQAKKPKTQTKPATPVHVPGKRKIDI